MKVCPSCNKEKKLLATKERCHNCYEHLRRRLYPERYKQKDRANYLRNRQKILEQKKEYHQKNKAVLNEKSRIICKRHYANNKWYYYAKDAKRRAQKLRATPKWADENKIKSIYENCPPGMEVDHIVPLQGATVCGLHVEYNLQYLTPTENRKKGNKCP